MNDVRVINSKNTRVAKSHDLSSILAEIVYRILVFLSSPVFKAAACVVAIFAGIAIVGAIEAGTISFFSGAVWSLLVSLGIIAL